MSFCEEIIYRGKKVTIETGKLAKQANGSVVVQCGDTIVLVTVTCEKKDVSMADFLPLTVDYQEKFYSAGRIPGGFFKREGRPTSEATLNARLIDRQLRPLFPEGFFYNVCVVATVLSVDHIHEPDVLACLGASAALELSDIPFNGPTAAAKVGRVNGNFILNPSPEEREKSDFDVLVACSKEGIVMVEGGAKFVSEKDMIDAFKFAFQELQPFLHAQQQLKAKFPKEKMDFEKPLIDASIKEKVLHLASSKVEAAFQIREKKQRNQTLKNIGDELKTSIIPVTADEKTKSLIDYQLKTVYEDLKYRLSRRLVTDKKVRIDGRDTVTVRPISSSVNVLPRVHGSSVFTRGETQVLATVTLGTLEDAQTIDSITGNYEKKFMLHYNFPPFSVGEARPLRAPGRREIGHGALAERAIEPVIPDQLKFPYIIRIVCEVLESNGSSSMATVCSSSMALMDAGVPTSEAIAGVAMGLIKENGKIAVLTDILGDEDHLGDMDFKVAGSERGITAIQMDIKITDVTFDIMEQALEQARVARKHILSEMTNSISKPKDNMSQYAPRIKTMQINVDKIRDVIGPGGKTIKGIIDKTGVKIDIDNSGMISIASIDEKSAEAAINIIKGLTAEAEIGQTYEGTVMRIVDFGAFVEILPGQEGLVHISELEHYRVKYVTDILKEGQKLNVKVLDIGMDGKIKLSRKALLPREPK